MVAKLLRYGVDIEVVPDYLGTVHYHSYNYNEPITGAGNALQSAAHSGQIEMVEFLLTKGANIDGGKSSMSALSIASSKGHRKLVELLVSKGANLNSTGLMLLPPLQAAAEWAD